MLSRLCAPSRACRGLALLPLSGLDTSYHQLVYFDAYLTLRGFVVSLFPCQALIAHLVSSFFGGTIHLGRLHTPSFPPGM